MKKILTLLIVATLMSCSKDDSCDCYAVSYTGRDGVNWNEVYRVKVDYTCEEEIIRNISSWNSQGYWTFRKDVIECK